ncbi:MAG: hypothetical protein OCU22_07995, partial [Canidatus Methanoxibalbensis ujae]|nr:hypothetical protein [Candidatus Methanoxibalbensis ujae]
EEIKGNISPNLQRDEAEDRIRNVAYSIDFAYSTGKPADGRRVWVWCGCGVRMWGYSAWKRDKEAVTGMHSCDDTMWAVFGSCEVAGVCRAV